jgi:uncharacterized protein (TIGR02145 family)
MNIIKFVTLSICLASISVFSKAQYKVKDIDNNTYESIKIGNQIWLKQNLKVTHYRNGDQILLITDKKDWCKFNVGSYSICNIPEGNIPEYGLLYNGFTVIDSRKICPAGWHIPSNQEWETLIEFLGGDSIAGGKLKEIGNTHWEEPNIKADNSSEFTALPGGFINDKGDFYYYGQLGYLWSSTKEKKGYWYYLVNYNSEHIIKIAGSNQIGLSVRCIRD